MSLCKGIIIDISSPSNTVYSLESTEHQHSIKRNKLFPTWYHWHARSHCSRHSEYLWNNEVNPLPLFSVRTDAGTVTACEDFCLQDKSGGSKLGPRGWEIREPSRKQNGDKLLKLGFKEKTWKNLQGKSLIKWSILTLSWKNETRERRKNDKNPNQDCNLKEKLSAIYIEFLGHIYTFITPKGFIVQSFCHPLGEK